MFVGFYFSLVCSSTARYESDLKEVNSDFIFVRASFPWCWHVNNFLLLRQLNMQSKTFKKLIEMQAVAYHILDRADGIRVLNWMYLINQSTACI